MVWQFRDKWITNYQLYFVGQLFIYVLDMDQFEGELAEHYANFRFSESEIGFFTPKLKNSSSILNF